MIINDKTWFESWFDMDYYHTLYKYRDFDEASEFIKRLFAFLNMPTTAKVLDVACGRGRHAVSVSKLGYDVTGIDLSQNSIAFAKKFESENLRFLQHDMCEPMSSKFDVVLNLFTSIGYFDDDEKNKKALLSFWENLKPNGVGVIDFLNVDYTSEKLVDSETIHSDGIDFFIQRKFDGNHFYKQIKFKDSNQTFSFTEKVKALRLKDFQSYFDEIGIKNFTCFGNYQLEEYNQQNSERLLILFYK